MSKTLELLWGGDPTARRRGPKPALSVERIAATAIAVADAEGLDALTMRRLARELGVVPMTLYGYVPGKRELLEVMLDAAYAAMPRPPWRARSWRARLTRVAEDNRALYAAHPWAATISSSRPPLGPGLMAKYEHELRAFDGTGLGDVQVDAALTFLLDFVRSSALAAQQAAQAQADSGQTDEEWWAANAPLLERVFDATRYPTAARVGAAAGAAQGGAYSPEAAWAFGLERVLDGLATLIG